MIKKREHWRSHLGFVLAAAGSAIGLGTLWKFPYIAGENGGGLFVLLYTACTFLIGVPIFIAELMLGRAAQRGAVGIFDRLAGHSFFWKIGGWLGVAASFLIMSYYSIIAGWGLYYVFLSLTHIYTDLSPSEIGNAFDQISSSWKETLFWHFVFTAMTVAVVYRGVRRGIEFWSKLMTSSLLLMIALLLFYSISLDGFGEAVRFLFYPDWRELTPSAALQALGLALFTLSLGQGIMLTYGSYMTRQEDIPVTAGFIAAMIIGISLLAGLVIFPIVFTFGMAPEAGPGLVFKTLPVLFAKLPASGILSTAFFLLFIFTALTSSIALVEVVTANFMDLLNWSREKSVLIVGGAAFLFGIPSMLSYTETLFFDWQGFFGKTFFRTVDDLVSIWLLPLGALMISIFTGWFWDREASMEEYGAGTSVKWSWKAWNFMIRWICPIAILLILLENLI